MKNWKTTTLGVLVILGALINAGVDYLKFGKLPDFGVLWAAVLSGIGLIKAADSNPTEPPKISLGAGVIIFALVFGLSGCAAIKAFDATHAQEIKIEGGYDEGAYTGGLTYRVEPLKYYPK